MLLLAAGCGDDKDEPAATASPDGTSAASECNPNAAPSVDPNATSVKPQRLSSLCSYRYTIATLGHNGPMSRSTQFTCANRPGCDANSDVQIAQIGQFVAPDRAVNAINFGFITSTSILIGDQIWAVVNGNVQAPSTASPEQVKAVNVAPSYWDTTGLLEDFGSFECGRTIETVNNVKTRTCVLDPQHYQENRRRFSGLLNDASIKSISDSICEVALSLDGYPIRLRIGLAGVDTQDKEFRVTMQMDLLDLNSKDIKIDTPTR